MLWEFWSEPLNTWEFWPGLSKALESPGNFDYAVLHPPGIFIWLFYDAWEF